MRVATSPTPAFDRAPTRTWTFGILSTYPPTPGGLATFSAVVDGDRCWVDAVAAPVGWFVGDNDEQLVIWDTRTAGGFDGPQPDRANLDQGTESTLALSTLRHARLPVAAPL